MATSCKLSSKLSEFIPFSQGHIKPAFLKYPVPLYLQCLIYIIGHIFDDNKDGKNSLWIDSLSLLPTAIRRQLLVHLPAIDVCKLEGTSVTDGILMDDIWEVLYKKRIPLLVRNKFNEFTKRPSLMSTIDSTNWKEDYFNVIFSYNQLLHINFFAPSGGSQHFSRLAKNNKNFLGKLLYCADGDLELNQCLVKITEVSFHGICQFISSARTHFIPHRYYRSFIDFPTHSDVMIMNKNGPTLSHKLVELLVNTCRVRFRNLLLVTFRFKTILESPQLCDLLPKLLESVQFINFLQCYHDVPIIKPVLDYIFTVCCPSSLNKSISIGDCPCCEAMKNKPATRGDLRSDYVLLHTLKDGIFLRLLLPYFTDTIIFKGLKELIVYDFLRILSASVDLIHILQSLENLEKLSLIFKYNEKMYSSGEQSHHKQLSQCIGEFFHKPTFNTLKLSVVGGHRHEVPSSMLKTLFDRFFSSPFPVGFSLNMSCTDLAYLPRTPICNNYYQQSKRLELKDCKFDCKFDWQLKYLIPHQLVLKSLILNCVDEKIIKVFEDLISINVDSITIHDISHLENLYSLLAKVTTQEWNLSLSQSITDDHSVSILCKGLANLEKGCLRYFGIHNTSSLGIFETIFNSIRPDIQSPYFVLSLTGDCNEDTAKGIYSTWEKCGGIKLKRIILSSSNIFMNESPYFNILLSMTLEIKLVL